MTDTSMSLPFDPAERTREEVFAYVDAHPEHARAVLDAERARGDKARPTVVDGMERRIAAAATPPPAGAPPAPTSPTGAPPPGGDTTTAAGAATLPSPGPAAPSAPTGATGPETGTQPPPWPGDVDGDDEPEARNLDNTPLTGDGAPRPADVDVDPADVVRLDDGAEATSDVPPESRDDYYSDTVGRKQPTGG